MRPLTPRPSRGLLSQELTSRARCCSWYKRSEFGIRAALFFSAATVSGAFGGLLAVRAFLYPLGAVADQARTFSLLTPAILALARTRLRNTARFLVLSTLTRV